MNESVGLVPASASLALDRDDAARASLRRPEQLLAEVSGALRANLTRGFLEGEERIRQVAEALKDVVLLTDAASGQVFFVNAAYEEIWGRPRADLYASPLELFEGVHHDDRDRVRDALLGQQRQNFDIEFRVVRPPADERWMWARGFPVRGVDGATNRIAFIIADVTEHKQVAESHEQLIRGFTHDIQNPLGAADGYLALFEAGVFGPMAEAQAQSIANARRSIRTAMHLVSSLLEIARAEAIQLSTEREEVDLAAVAFEVAAEFRAAATAKHLDLTVSRDDESHVSLVIEADGTRLRQIVANLVSNAVKYTPPEGQIRVVARAARPGETPRRGRWATVTVTDNGPGIPLEKQAMVFREFARFDPGAAAGSGIGLTISRRLARALGGDITFTSRPGIGSAFTLWLPLHPSRTPADAPRAPSVEAQARNTTRPSRCSRA